MAFTGWPAEAVEFYEGLEADNSKTYWTAHKPVFDSQVHAPMAALVEELADEFGAGKIFRPYRDVRFSKDKTPYKTGIYATWERGGYVRFSAHGLTVGRGYYLMAPEQVDRYRRAVAHDATGPRLEDAIAAVEAAGIRVGGAPSLRSAPRGYPKDHPRIALLKHKGLIAWRDFEVAAWLGTRAAKQRILDTLHAAAPLQRWLDDHVGSG